MGETGRPARWKVVMATILDIILVFGGGGYLIAWLTGNTTEGGFNLQGLPALALFVLIGLYFWGMPKIGGTVFRRVFGAV